MNYGKHKTWSKHKNKKYQGKVEEMVELKPSRPPEGNELKNPTERNKGKAFKPKKYRGKNHQNKPIPELEPETDL